MARIISCVPQDSDSDVILLFIYVNDIDESFTCKISKDADDTKISGGVATTAEKMQLQSNLNILVSWSKKVANQI